MRPMRSELQKETGKLSERGFGVVVFDQCLPVLPKPPAPRWLSGNSSTTLN